MSYMSDMRQQVFATYGSHDPNDDSVLGRMEIAEILFAALDASAQTGLQLPEFYATERAEQMAMIQQRTLTAGDDINRPQVAAVIDVLIRGIEIEGRVVDGYNSLKTSTVVKVSSLYKSRCFRTIYPVAHVAFFLYRQGSVLTKDLDDFMNKYLKDNVDSASLFAKGLLERIHTRGLEVAALLDAAVAHIVADHSRLSVDTGGSLSPHGPRGLTVSRFLTPPFPLVSFTAAVLKEIEVWEANQLVVVEETLQKVTAEMTQPVWPSPNSSPRSDPGDYRSPALPACALNPFFNHSQARTTSPQ